MKVWVIVAVLASSFTPSLRATEVDNFTDRDIPLSDSREYLNGKMNESISLAMEKTNRKFDCGLSPEAAQNYFYKKLNKRIGGFWFAKYELEIEKDDSVEKRRPSKKESIYRTLSVRNSFALYLAKLGSIVNVGGNYVGTDKLGHFIGIGKVYFDKMRKKGKTLEEVMRYGQRSEESFFGLQTTGIFSYADLVANYEGLLFWESLFGGNGPYLNCVDGSLVLNRSFEWLDYVNDAWDESINCSRFRNGLIRSRVHSEIKSKTNSETACPLVPLREETLLRYLNTPLPVLRVNDDLLAKLEL